MPQKLLLCLVVLLICSSFLFGCEYKPKWEDFKGGIHLVLEVEARGNSSIDEKNTVIIRDILSERAKQFGFKKKIIKIDGERRIIVQLPKVKQPQRVIDLFGKSYFLEFKLVDEENSLEEALKGNIPEGREILYKNTFDQETRSNKKVPFLVYKKASLSGEHIKKAKVQSGQRTEPQIELTFTNTGAQIFRQVTKENVRKNLAIIFDNYVYSAPRIQEEIPSGRAQITGNFTMEEAQDLAITLNAGSYPVPTKIIASLELTRSYFKTLNQVQD